MKFQLKTRQVCLFFIAFLPVSKLFTMPSIIAGCASEDMWISTLINLLLDLITLSFVLWTCKKTKTDFFGLLELNFGKLGSKIILLLYFFTFFFKALLPINQQKTYVELTLYETLPSFLNFLPFFLVSFFFCCKRIRVLGRVADIFWVITLIGLILIFLLSFTNSDFSAVLPIGAQGFINQSKGAFYSFNWFGDCAYLMFFIGQFQVKKKDCVKVFLSYLIPGLFVVFFMIIFYGVFTSIAFRQIFALTEISKYTIVINNIGRFDYVGIICILASNFFALALPLYFASLILNKIFNIKPWICSLIVNGLTCFCVLAFAEHFASIEKFLSVYGNALFFITANVLPIITCVLKKENKENEVSAC